MPCRCRHAGNQRIRCATHLRDGTAPLGVSLNSLIDFPRVNAWNVQQTMPEVRQMLDLTQPWVEIQSDADDQQLLHLPFAEFLRIKAITIVGGGGGTTPARVSLYTNRNDIHGFESVERLQAQDTIDVIETSDEEELVYQLDAMKFMSCGSLTLLVSSSHDGEESRLRRIVLFGESTRLSTERKMATNVVYELRPNPADNPQPEEDMMKNNLVS